MINEHDTFGIQRFISDEQDGQDFISLLSQEEEDEMNKEILPESLPILPLRNTVLFPGVVIPITVGRDKSITLIKEAYKNKQSIGVVTQLNAQVEDPEFGDLYQTGTVAHIMKMLRMPDGNTTVIIQGKRRFKLNQCLSTDPYITATITAMPEAKLEMDKELTALVSSIKDLALQIIEVSPYIPSEASIAIRNIESPKFLINFISSNMNLDVAGKQAILEIEAFKTRGEKVLENLTKELQQLQLKNEIQSKVRGDMDKQQREFFLQQQIRALQEELGQDSPEREIENMLKSAEAKKWSESVHQAFKKEVEKLRRMNPMAPDYSMQTSYLQTLLDLPWNDFTQDDFDLKRAERILNEDHFGLEKIKERILEYLAVLKLKGNMKSPILCLVGPPGVGKTSLGKSIAKSLNRKYARIALGGLHDESEIRGHRRTYIGAMPGRIIQNLKKVNSSNPVFVLDEIDKIGNSFRGDPSSALLEVLDPEQNHSFYDNYIEIDYDLSNVMFIATANSLDTIQPALLDRMEIIEVNGYTLEEKIQIAKTYLIPKQQENHGLKKNDFELTDTALEKVIESYTRESGVRNLEKQIAAIARNVAKQKVMSKKVKKKMDPAAVVGILGIERVEKESYQNNDTAGVVTGLAWTSVGGEILFIESSLTKGTGKLTLTGHLGDVMKESAITALTFLKAHSTYLGIEPTIFDKWDLHIHVPAGAVPKDGPSAGITMLTSLASVFTQRKVRAKLAMTGEITLRGKVLPIGGVKEKILAAKRAGIEDIILCEANRKDVADIHADYIKDLRFHFVNNMLEVIDIALLEEKVSGAIDLNPVAVDKK
ncbi:MAG: endopeptidase La [Bacteroidia bacterium]|jgi:ATP-dependent Lon protease|nr:endopeptidase La [Bacteroidia bacterium]